MIKIILYGLLILISILNIISCKPSAKSQPGIAEISMLNKFNDLKATTKTIINNDTLRLYHIEAKLSNDSTLNFGWFNFRVLVYKDSDQALAAFNSWKYRLKNNIGDEQEISKSPQYRLQYSNFIYGIESGCFNEKNVDSVFHVFLKCANFTEIDEKNSVKVKCGGAIAN